MANGQIPIVSVIVPARNEEACLAQCLESLVPQTGIDFEVIVVDDASTDRTAEIAQSFVTAHQTGAGTVVHTHAPDSGTTGKGTSSTRANFAPTLDTHGTAGSRALTGEPSVSKNCLAVTLIAAPPLPENWTGKNNAMSAGAKIARGKWLLFTDADTVHKPGSLARAVAEAEEQGAALLSYSPEQEVRTFWEKAVMPVIFAQLAATYPPKKVNDPASSIAAANGQYLLISRAAYDAVGGHTKIASDLLEDVAMARLVKLSGRKIFFRYGGDAVRTRMYRNWAQMKEGWTKNLALLFKRPRALALLRATELLVVCWSVVCGIAALCSNRYQLASMMLLSGSIAGISAWTRIQRAHFPLTSNPLVIPGLGLFSYLLMRSSKLHRSHSVTWKSRLYGDLRIPVASPQFMENVEDLPVQERQQ